MYRCAIWIESLANVCRQFYPWIDPFLEGPAFGGYFVGIWATDFNMCKISLLIFRYKLYIDTQAEWKVKLYVELKLNLVEVYLLEFMHQS